LLAALTASTQVAAQESPDETAAPAEEAAMPPSDAAPEEGAPVADESTQPYESEPSSEDLGYSDSAPEADVVAVAATDAQDAAPAVRVGGELGFFFARGDAGNRLSLSPIVNVGLGVSDAIEVGVRLGAIYHSNGLPESMMTGGGNSALRVGNPELWIARHSRSKDTHMTFGGGITLPMASLNGAPWKSPEASATTSTDGWIASDAYAHASAIRGDWNQWLWSPNKVAGVVNFEAHGVMDGVLVGGEAAMGLLIPLLGDDCRQPKAAPPPAPAPIPVACDAHRVGIADAAFVGQAAGELGYATDSVRVVMRAQMVATVTPSIDDVLQFSIAPYVAWDMSDSVTLTGNTTVNIDNPTGFDGLRIWGVRLGANVKL
jgi:hypothetical protein